MIILYVMPFTYLLVFFYIIICFFSITSNSIKIIYLHFIVFYSLYIYITFYTLNYYIIEYAFADNFSHKNNATKEISPISFVWLSKIVYLFFYYNISENITAQKWNYFVLCDVWSDFTWFIYACYIIIVENLLMFDFSSC